jgi:transaldolase
MKIFLDTANVATIKQWAPSGLIDGVTTNPTHLAKEGGNPLAIIKEICSILPAGDINVQVTEKSPDALYKQAHEIAKISNNITVKIPCSRDYYPVIKRLVEEGVRVNITLVFSLTQGLFMAKLGVRYISPFVGRLDDAGEEGLELVEELVQMTDLYECKTEILVASVRTVEQINAVVLMGAHVATVSAKLLEQASAHPLTDKGMSLFAADWEKLGARQFPR